MSFKPWDCFNRRGEPKTAFASKKEAKAVAKTHNWGAVRVYKCPYGHGWHLGNPETKERVDD